MRKEVGSRVHMHILSTAESEGAAPPCAGKELSLCRGTGDGGGMGCPSGFSLRATTSWEVASGVSRPPVPRIL